MDCTIPPSPALLDANRLLLEQRQKQQGTHLPQRFDFAAPWEEDTTPPVIVEGLPAYLGWNSQTATVHLRYAERRRDGIKTAVSSDSPGCVPQQAGNSAPIQSISQPLPELTPKKDNIRLYPDIALGIADALAASIPEHLGWGSEALTAVIRQQQPVCDDDSAWISCFAETAVSAKLNTGVSTQFGATASARNQPSIENPAVKLYPHIGLGMLQQEKTAAGRLWLMLHHLDSSGSGQLRIDILRATLTTKASTLYLCGKRHLRNLLRDGDGLFWARDKERVWLQSAARVAHGLGVERLTGRPVSVPVSALLAGIANFRAHLYAAFHSGRTKRGSGKQSHQPMPIARETLTRLSGVGQSSQRTYEAKTKVTIQTNYAIGEVVGAEKWEDRAWTQGRAVFELKDYRGEQGKKGNIYLAWQLPNSYTGKQQQRPLGRQKRINRTLRDLVMKGMPGNSGEASDVDEPKKRYYPNGKLAATAHGRDLEQELYWRRQRNRKASAVWQQL